MRGMLAAEHIGPEELAARPVGCLGLCKQGPVMVAVKGDAAAAKKPPKPSKKKRSAGVWTRVKPEEMRDVLREALLGPL